MSVQHVHRHTMKDSTEEATSFWGCRSETQYQQHTITTSSTSHLFFHCDSTPQGVTCLTVDVDGSDRTHFASPVNSYRNLGNEFVNL